jgi:bifunctional non-homologous end joining protein LigD
MPESKTLEKYKQKRDRSKTPEPFAGEPKDKDVLRFTIQKHAATRLHYDLRLEMDGVLKSWAVPKGPSTDPEVKRLAMMVEDHPFDYRDFEGIIPKGEYGAGTVIVWDEGTYEASHLEGKSKKEQEKHLLQSLNEGTLKVTLHGKKLKGEYALFRIKANEENTWLMVKHKDKYASKTDITLKDKSVQSGKTIEKVKATSKNIYGADKKPEETEKTALKTDDKNPKTLSEKAKAILEKAPDAKMPASVKPMLATLVDEPFDDPDWLFEVKWDGYRSIGLINKGNVQLLSRNNKSFTEKYYPITESLREWKFDAVIDGELIVLRENGSSDFEAQQNWRSEADGELVMYVFDLLWYNGKSLFSLPLTERKVILEEILPDNNSNIRLSQSFQGNGKEFFETAGKLGLEGMIAKKANSINTPDIRTKNLLKIIEQKRQ